MKKRGSPPNRRRSAGAGTIIGRERFDKISEVEGIRPTQAMKRRQAQFDRERLSPEERIRRIIAVHRNG